MAVEKLYAFTNIDHNNEFIPYGTEIDRSKFTKEELVELVRNGAVSRYNRAEVEQPEITVDDIESEVSVDTSDTKDKTPKP